MEVKNREIERLQRVQQQTVEKSEELFKNNGDLKGELDKSRRISQSFNDIKVSIVYLYNKLRLYISGLCQGKCF